MYSSVSRTRCASLLYQLTLCTGLAVLSLQHRCASLLYQLTFCTGLAVLSLQHRGCTGALELTLQQALQMTVCKIISPPRCDQLQPTSSNMTDFQVSVPAGNLSAATDSRHAGDTINGPDRFVYLTYCKWRRLYAVCSKCCCVSL